MSIHLPAFIKTDLIQQKTIREYIENKGLRISCDFDQLDTTCYKPAERDSYYVHTKSFLVKSDLDTVWKTYLTIPPRETWRSRMVSFGCMYCKQSKSLTYLKDQYNGLSEGQVLFLNISLFWGMLNIAVAHQITRIDAIEKYIEFSYIEGGKTEGSQRLIFQETPDYQTRIIHRTTYRGKTRSYLREKRLYPYLHGKVIAAFHRNVELKVLEIG